MDSLKRNWIFPFLWPNLAVGVVVLVLIAARQISSFHDLLHVLAYSLAYANLVSIFGILLITGLTKGLSLRKLPMVPVIALCVVVVVPIGCLLVQSLLMLIGVVVTQNFWREYVSTLRVSMPLALVFGFGAFVHASLREHLQDTERKLHQTEIAGERSRKLAIEARLRSLESRIHPHFLFNTLNSISSLIPVNPARAEQIVGRLAALLRASLDNSNQPLITMQQELTMVESYLDIERVRLGERFKGSIEVPLELQACKVPPMSVQSLVENAVKYGIAPHNQNGEITVRASAENGNLRIEISDTGIGFDLSKVPSGHGLDNLVERLDALFGERARLNVERRNGHCVVEMVLPRV